MQKHERAMALREGGWPIRWHIERCHKEDSIANHSHQMMVLGYALFDGQITPALARAITFHDLHERWVGDWPWGAKGPLSGGEARALEHKLAMKVRNVLGIEIELNGEEAEILAFLDLLDATLFAREEVLMGNMLMRRKLEDCTANLRLMPLFNETVEAMLSCPISDELPWVKEMMS